MTKRKTNIPKPVSLTIRIYPEFTEVLEDDGRRRFVCMLPHLGFTDIRIIADNINQAKSVLEEYLYNELNNHDDLYNE